MSINCSHSGHWPRICPSKYKSTPVTLAYSSFNIQKLLSKPKKPVISPNENVLTRSVKFEHNKEERRKEILQECNQNMMKECTFKPKVNRVSGDKKRSMKEFLEAQDMFIKKVGDKREQIKNSIK